MNRGYLFSVVSVVGTDMEQRRLLFGVPAQFGQVIAAIGLPLLFSLQPPFGFVTLLLLAGLFLLTLIEC